MLQLNTQHVLAVCSKGDINVLLLGDPGTAKSQVHCWPLTAETHPGFCQFLKFANQVAPIAVCPFHVTIEGLSSEHQTCLGCLFFFSRYPTRVRFSL